MGMKRIRLALVAVSLMLLAACATATDPVVSGGSEPQASDVSATDTGVVTAEEPSSAATPLGGSSSSEIAAEAPTGDPLRLILLTNETGTFANISADAQLGVQARVDAINAEGGVLGRPLEVETIDVESDPTRATSVAEGIEPADDLIGVVGPEGTATCFAVRSVLIEKGVVQYCNSGAPIPGAPDGLIPGDFSPYYFMLHPPPTAAGGSVPITWMEESGYETMALITSSDASGQVYAQALNATLDGQVEIVAEESFDATSPDVTAQMTTIRAADPDVIYIGTTGAGLATILQAARDLGVETPMWAGWGNAALSVAGLVSDVLPPGGLMTYGEGVHVIDDLPPDHPQVEALQAAEALWQKDFGTALSVDGALMWDAVSNLVSAVEGAGTAEADAVVAWLEQDSEEIIGLAGVYDFTAEDHRGTRSSGLVIRYTEDGGFALETTVNGS